MTDSHKLLAEYVQTGSEAAFRELVARHINLVYSVALRLVEGDTHRAEDVAQTVFVDLAAKARTLSPDVLLGGWLHRHTCFVAANTMRGERRRLSRERQAAEMNALNDNSNADYSLIAPILDEAINELSEADRSAIVLRFFEQRDFRSLGESLGSNEDAARMRVNRALEKLQSLLKRRGVATSTAVLAGTLSANAIQAAPLGLAVTISTAAIAGTGIAATAASTVTATKAIAMTTLQKTLLATAFIAAAGVGTYEARQASAMRTRLQALQQQQAPLREQLQQLQRERDEAMSKLAVRQQENEQLRRSLAEIPRLRGEVARLRGDAQDSKATISNETTEFAARSWVHRASQLKQHLEQAPDQKIPELQLVTEEDWLNAAKGKLETETDFRRAMSAVRGAGEQKFVTTLLQPALKEYRRVNNGQLPADLSELQPYFKPTVDAAILERWEVAPADTVKALGMGGDVIITQKVAVDDVYDTRYGVGPNGYGSTDFLSSLTRDVLGRLNRAFAAANNGKYPEDFSQLLPYAVTPEQQAALQKLIQKKAADK